MDDWQYERDCLILLHDADDFPHQRRRWNIINALGGVETWASSAKASATLGGKNGMAARLGVVLSKAGICLESKLIVAFYMWRPW